MFPLSYRVPVGVPIGKSCGFIRFDSFDSIRIPQYSASDRSSNSNYRNLNKNGPVPVGSYTYRKLERDRNRMEHAATGAAVGLMDVAFIYPLAVLATRRECGLSVRSAIAQRHFWSGGLTAGTLLVPYSMAVEGVSHAVQFPNPWVAALTTTMVTAPAFQVIEKKLVMDQMLQDVVTAGGTDTGKLTAASSHRSGPLAALAAPAKQIAAYARLHGTKHLFDGFVPFFGRELTYIAAIVVVNPMVTGAISARWADASSAGVTATAGAFGVGWAAGWITAPFQTLSAMMKHDKNRGVNALAHLRNMFYPTPRIDTAQPRLHLLQGLRRLFFGAGIRSIRTGGAGILYFQARHFSALYFGKSKREHQ